MKRKIIVFTSISLLLLLVFVGIFFVIKHSKNNVPEQVTDGEQKYFYIEVDSKDFEITNGVETARANGHIITGDFDIMYCGLLYGLPDFESAEQEYKIKLLRDDFDSLMYSYDLNEDDYFFFSFDTSSSADITLTKRKTFDIAYEKPTFFRLTLAGESDTPWLSTTYSSTLPSLSGKIEGDKIYLYSEKDACIDISINGIHDELEIKNIPIDKDGIIITSDRKGNCIIKRKWKVLHKEYFEWPIEE